ncbi:MAG: hypothetical protein QM621_09375 [Aeromicrobium sp.]|uniref:hypothetical protein n=1 Tax=Aeromicrobium sp. TaxID=1871063 RepID=UPI0039E6225B
MRLDRYRRPLAATAIVAAALTAGACGTSFSAQTNQQYQASIGADLRQGPVQVLGASLVTGEDGSATLSATLVNTTDAEQSLTSATLTDSDGEEHTLTSTSSDVLAISPGEARALGLVDDESQRHRSKVYTTTGIEPVGSYYTLTLNFTDAGPVEISIPSVVRNSIYKDVALPPGADPAENDKKPGGHLAELGGGSGDEEAHSSGH